VEGGVRRRGAILLTALLASGCAGARRTPAIFPDAGILPRAVSLPELDASAAPPPAIDEGGSAPAAAGDAGAGAAQPERAPRSATPRDRAAPSGARPLGRGAEPTAALRVAVLDAARRLLGTRPRLDCSGYVLSAFAAAGVVLELHPARSRSESLYRVSRVVTRPAPGDLVFFHDTHDRDHNGRRGDRFTHVALVETVDGTALTLLHRGGRRVERIRMDLSRPSDRAANDAVRFRRRRDAPGTRYLSGELFAAFGALLPNEVTPMLQARRGRDTSTRHPATR
jgi:hypothetical protein